MQFIPETNLTEIDRQAKLFEWINDNEVTFTAMGKHMTGVTGRPVTGNAVKKALMQERMPVKNHKALRDAYPNLPVELLPEPRNVPTGPRPKIPRSPALEQQQQQSV